MSDKITIALDAMGGDDAPHIVVAGANIARRRHPDVRFLLCGDAEDITARVARQRGLDEFVEVVHAPDIVGPEDKPSKIVRGGQETSMWRSIKTVKDGRADAVVSAGNTGALLAIAMLVLKRLEGIDRPAIASFFPTLRGETVMLDLGANLRCTERNLVEYAIMGEVFARTVLGIENPTIGLLNIGEEQTKGNDALKDAAQLLRDIDLPGEFVGFVEGNDIPAGAVDVVVTDGFTGNVALKTAEGTAKLINAFVRETFRNSFWAKIGYIFAKRSFDKLRSRSDPRRYNGAMFLGLDGVCVKSHGGTDAVGFATAIGVAIDMVKYGGNASLKTTVESLEPGILSPQSAAVAS
ncbi:MAG: phosphate acyltransferase [Alphaproteobacteria bacterium]|nr:phosphate acyltransferase [Alphaproteobacteria bacterium]